MAAHKLQEHGQGACVPMCAAVGAWACAYAYVPLPLCMCMWECASGLCVCMPACMCAFACMCG